MAFPKLCKASENLFILTEIRNKNNNVLERQIILGYEIDSSSNFRKRVMPRTTRGGDTFTGGQTILQNREKSVYIQK